jgi:hypothetical protein
MLEIGVTSLFSGPMPLAGITSSNATVGFAITSDSLEGDAVQAGLYNIAFNQATTTLGGVILNIKNISLAVKGGNNKNIIIHRTRLFSAAADTYTWRFNDTGTAVGTTQTPQNRQSGSANTMTSAQVLSLVTGLTAAAPSQVASVFPGLANVPMDMLEKIVISPGTSASLVSTTGSIGANVLINLTLSNRAY